MSKDEFMINYNNCKSLNREIRSNINYIDSINERLTSSNQKLVFLTKSSVDVWNPDASIEQNTYTKNVLNNEKERYEEFYTKFEVFYKNVEDLDSELASYLSSQISLIDKNDTYEFFVAGIQLNQNDLITEDVYNILIESGLSDDKAKSLVMLLSIEGQNEIIRLSKFSDEELNKERERLINKENKSLLDKVMAEVLAYPNAQNFISDLSSTLETSTFSSYVEKAILGRSLTQAKLDVNSIKGSINKLMNKIVSPGISAASRQKTRDLLTHLNGIGGARIAKIKFTENTVGALQKVGQGVTVLFATLDTIDNYNNNIDNYEKYGVDVNRAAYDFIVDETGLITSIVAGGKIGSAVGTAIGGPVGLVVGVVVGAGVGIISDVTINVIGDGLYDNVIEPAVDWWNDTCNDIGDWWDSLWW